MAVAGSAAAYCTPLIVIGGSIKGAAQDKLRIALVTHYFFVNAKTAQTGRFLSVFDHREPITYISYIFNISIITRASGKFFP